MPGAATRAERAPLANGATMSRLIKGGWQLGDGHGDKPDQRQAMADMAAFVEAGITTFSCADHYLGVEQLIGDFRRAYPSLASSVQVYTAFVPDLDRLDSLDRAYVQGIIDRSLQRLGVERLDLLQFAWWDYSYSRVQDAVAILLDLQREGKIAELGVTNFNTAWLRKLWDLGFHMVGNQLQYSLLDRRPQEQGTSAFCRANGVAMLPYGALAGGFIDEKWLGAPEPGEPYANRSLRKYKLIIEDFGGWPLFQELLRVLQAIGHRHGVGIGTVALRWTLDQPGVGGIMVGATSTRHLEANLKAYDIALTAADRAEIAAVTDRREGPPGDCFDVERDRNGRHGRIMRYNPNVGRV